MKISWHKMKINNIIYSLSGIEYEMVLIAISILFNLVNCEIKHQAEISFFPFFLCW